jgi:hypothetical protein
VVGELELRRDVNDPGDPRPVPIWINCAWGGTPVVFSDIVLGSRRLVAETTVGANDVTKN